MLCFRDYKVFILLFPVIKYSVTEGLQDNIVIVYA